VLQCQDIYTVMDILDDACAGTGEYLSVVICLNFLFILNIVVTTNQLDQDMVFVEYRMHHGE